MSGWIKIHRQIRKHWLWQDAEKLKRWLHILLEANHEDGKVLLKGVLVECKRGQCVRSLQSWAKDWRCSTKSVSNFFLLLESEGMIVTESVTVSTRLTICKYESYQEGGNAEETQKKRRGNAGETQGSHKQEVKNNKEEKKEYRAHVHLFEKEHAALVEKHGAEGTDWILDKLDSYKLSKGKQYASDYGAINNWVVKEYEKQKAAGTINPLNNLFNEPASHIRKADPAALASKYD